ncbi:MAG TPA: hypothetical protein VFO55_02360 [Gemmatimonadaceae bacterium]|nr:hypothetical protein [Gemmatimonadaceae bacterium]
MEHVELLLSLAGGRELRVEDAAAVIHAGVDVAARRLADLEAAGLVARDQGDRALFRYSPRTVESRAAVEELSRMYNQRPVTLVRSIYERPVSPIRSFADAFRFRSDE